MIFRVGPVKKDTLYLLIVSGISTLTVCDVTHRLTDDLCELSCGASASNDHMIPSVLSPPLYELIQWLHPHSWMYFYENAAHISLDVSQFWPFKTITAVNQFRWNCALTRQITRRFRQFCQHLSCCCEVGKQPLRWKDDLKKVRAQFSNSSMGCFSVRLRWSCHRCAWVHYWLFCRAQKSFSSKQAGKG